MHISLRQRASVLWVAFAFAVLAFFVSAPFAHAASSISIDSVPPPGCQLSNTQVSITGSATADAPPGQLEQYKVDISWGDGAHTTALNAGAFGSGHGTGGPLPFSGSHTYTTPGTYHIIATVYHSSLTGNDNIDSGENSFVVCIVSPLTITKTANTSFTRTYAWTIDKTADNTNLLLADGEDFTVNYGVTANATPTDSNWAVSGNITIANPVGNPTVTVNSVTDNLSVDGAATVSCPASTIAAGTSLVCTYSKSLGAATNQTNTATVDVTENILDGSSAPVAVTFGAPTTLTDECATFTDTNAAGPQAQQLCAGVDTLPKTWNYSLSFGKDAGAQVQLVCGANSYQNTASFTTNDTAAIGSDSVTVNSTVTCQQGGGCTLTQGYWKTHNASFKGGASKHADSTWDLIVALKEQTAFMLSGSTWFGVFWTPPGGNAYYQLAHQYMAARLNQLNGAGFPAAVQTAFNSATTLLTNNTPAQAGALKGNAKNTWTNLSGILGNYNEGNAGVPHCSEQN